MGKKTYIDSTTRMTLIKRNTMNVLFAIEGRTSKNRYNDYLDVTISLFSKGLDSYLASKLNVSVQEQLNNLTFDSNPTEYFQRLDAILNNTGPPQIVHLYDVNLISYYGPYTNPPASPISIHAFSGTTFSSSILSTLGPSPYIMIPSTYSITFDGDTYQTFGSGSTATLKKNGVDLATVGQTYIIGAYTFRFVKGGSPSISINTVCYTNPILDSGLNSDVPSNIVDSGELGDNELCIIDGGLLI